MDKKPENPAAFPASLGAEQTGMTLRDYFAAAVLQGMNASITGTTCWPTTEQRQQMAAFAYYQADAMLRQREENND